MIDKVRLYILYYKAKPLYVISVIRNFLQGPARPLLRPWLMVYNEEVLYYIGLSINYLFVLFGI